jgi:archaemetzincin
LGRFLSLYFRRPVEWQDPLEGAGRRRKASHSPSAGLQYHTDPILHALARKIPPGARLVMGLTLYDLYPDESWNFVFGVAVPSRRVGVYSLARLSHWFHGARVDARERRDALLRAMKVLAHEVGHLMGLSHCVKYSCLMAGTNSLEETDRHPLHLCPVCLAKLAWSLGFDVAARYEQLARFLHAHGLDEQGRWYDRQVTRLKDGKTDSASPDINPATTRSATALR